MGQEIGKCEVVSLGGPGTPRAESSHDTVSLWGASKHSHALPLFTIMKETGSKAHTGTQISSLLVWRSCSDQALRVRVRVCVNLKTQGIGVGTEVRR